MDKKPDRLDCFQDKLWIDIERIVHVADDIMNISPEISWRELFNSICEKTAILTGSGAATCKTFDPDKQMMFADGNYNFYVNRITEIPPANTVAGKVLNTKEHCCVSDINKELLCHEKDKILALGYR